MHVRDGRYVYTSRRIAGRVRTIYVGMVGSQAVADYEQARKVEAEAAAAVVDVPAVDGVLQALERRAMSELGYFRTNQRKWRKHANRKHQDS